jgi:hypothetical protein
MTILGPNLSLSLPDMMLKKPYTITLSEKAPEVSALLQPNSSISGLKKTPKVNRVPKDTAWIQKADKTTI